MDRDAGFFLVALGIFFILLQTALWKPLFSNPFIPPIILIIFGISLLTIGVVQPLRPFGTLINWLFVMSIIFFVMAQGFSFATWQESLSLNEYYAVDASQGVLVYFGAGDIIITQINDSYIHLTGSVDAQYRIQAGSPGEVVVTGGVGSIDIVSLPASVSRVSMTLGVGEAIYSTSNQNASVTYAVAVGSYNSPGRERCVFCSGQVTLGSNGIPVDIAVDVGSILVR
ncbi:hypothetical protein COT72_04335 [archaeon CG10_big_fil_rev_8_21_14_0_10_43_11]|nr:MAG: hypothetical protein COT72_04335 [archaeon CG10_big_fil_rev_8_21_14_0_10_43_11]